MTTNKQLKVVHLPVNIAGMAWGLAQGQKTLGLHAEVVVRERNYLDYPADRVIFEGGKRVRRNRRYVILLREALRLRKRFDVFHFDFGTSLIDRWEKGRPLLDLPMFKNHGKIAVTYNGCDARQKYPTMERVPFSACHNDACYDCICVDKKRDELKRKRIEKFSRYADAIFAVNPDLLYFLPERAQFLPYTIARWDEIEPAPWEPPTHALRIVHAPTNRAAKGSDIIIRAVEALKERYGERIDFKLVENMSNDKALEAYAKADLIIDQILIGWYGGVAVEVMKMGKPVMAFIRKEDLAFLPPGMAAQCEEAVLNASPTTIEDVLSEVVENPEILKRYREAAFEYVHAWHSPTHVAGVTREAYER